MNLHDIIRNGNDGKDKFGKKTPTLYDMADKYDVSMEEVLKQVKKGIKVEKEHTTDPEIALEIALDHINEDLYYYEKLATIEKH